MSSRGRVPGAGLAGRVALTFAGAAGLLTVVQRLAGDGSARSWPDAGVLGLIGGAGAAFLVWATAGAPEAAMTARRAVTRGALPAGGEPERLREALLHVKRSNRRLVGFVVLVLVGAAGLWLAAVDPADLVDPDLWWIPPALLAVLAVSALALGRWLDGRADRLLSELAG